MQTQTDDPAVVRLAAEGELTIFTVGDWHRRVTEVLDGGAQLQFDVSAVEEIDSAGLQLLLMLAADKGARVLLAGASAAVQRIVTLAGVGAVLEASGEG